MPKRIQRQRTAGWRMPDGAVYVGRPTVWGNPFRIGEPDVSGQPMTRADTVRRYIEIIIASGRWESAQRELAGKDLACWCPVGTLCHADYLLAIANKQPYSIPEVGA